MDVTIVDYKSGNISSVINSFKEVAKDKVNIEVTSDLNKIKSSDKVVLPGQGSFKSCVDALNNINGLVNTLSEFAIKDKKPAENVRAMKEVLDKIGIPKQIMGDDEGAWNSTEFIRLLNSHNIKK